MPKGKEPEEKWEEGHYSIAEFENNGRLNYTIQKLHWDYEYDPTGKLKVEKNEKTGLEQPVRKINPFSLPFLTLEELRLFRGLIDKVIQDRWKQEE